MPSRPQMGEKALAPVPGTAPLLPVAITLAPAMDRFLSPSEVARRFGVSIKALRLYERRGLIKPLRSAAGWRAYGPGQIGRLHQILALKQLGLSLEIGSASCRERV